MKFIDIRLCGCVSILIKEFAGVCQRYGHSLFQRNCSGKRFPHLKANIKGWSCTGSLVWHLLPIRQNESPCEYFFMLLYILVVALRENVQIQYALNFRSLR